MMELAKAAVNLPPLEKSLWEGRRGKVAPRAGGRAGRRDFGVTYILLLNLLIDQRENTFQKTVQDKPSK